MLDDSNACSLSHAPDQIPDHKLFSFAQVVETQRNYLIWVAGRMTTSMDEAEDIVQQALLKAFVNLSRFRGDATMQTWLHTIVLNTAREHLRNQKKRVPLKMTGLYGGDDENILRALPHPGMNPEEFYEQREIAAILQAEIGMLTPVCKHALELCVASDLPYQAIASSLGRSVATVKSRVHRAKAMLRRAVALHIQPGKGVNEREDISEKKPVGRRVQVQTNAAFSPAIVDKPAHAMQ